MKGIQALAPKVRNLRVAGSAAMHLAYVAAGRLSGFWEYNLSAWDIAAGALLVEEAGGRMSDVAGERYHLGVRNVVASNGHVHDELIEELRKASLT
jgi:myo-inositol-1(or 4)-monophosphatase